MFSPGEVSRDEEIQDSFNLTYAGGESEGISCLFKTTTVFFV